MILELLVVGLIVFLFISSSILVWEKQNEKHKRAQKWMRQVKKNDKNN
tara:strand:+ start:286 stop:429 length:144 start_codon:yes stop_codon:yes gene_type:complete